jgi:hypothetical protein
LLGQAAAPDLIEVRQLVENLASSLLNTAS